jgi:hypothetical protein
MALVELGKQFAAQVVGDKVNSLIDTLRPPDAAKLAEAIKTEKPAVPAPGENISATILGQIQAMQKACREDQELVVLCTSAIEALRVLEFYAPSPQVLVMTGIDANRNVTRIVAPIESVQVTCKVLPVQEGGKAARISFVVVKPKA